MSKTRVGYSLRCPSCKAKITWDTSNPNRPFCSESCKNKDFIAWANEKNNLPGNRELDELFSSELGEQNY